MGISPRQFEQIKKRLASRSRDSARDRAFDITLPTSAAGHKIILGVDPSLRGTGFGVVKLGTKGPQALAQGTIRCPALWPRSHCLAEITRQLSEVVAHHQPTVCAIEGLFFAQNVRTALIMGEARGAALAAIAAAGLEIFEIAPRKVKQAITGYGNAQKVAVAKMVQRLLALPERPAPDAADALALALAHAHLHNRFAIDPPRKI